VPAARDDLARGRQQLLATIILMGINRIVVTDGKINAKIRFNFAAKEQQKISASAFDYGYVGQKASSTKTMKNVGDQTGDGSGDTQVDTSKWTTAEQQKYAYAQMNSQNQRNRYAIGFQLHER